MRIFRKVSQHQDFRDNVADGEFLKREGDDLVGAAGGGGGGAPTDATYITQTANGDLSNEQALSALSTGLVKVTNGTGVLSTAVGGTDYANASHQHAGEDITSGTVADARIASTIARDSEVTSAISAHESDTTNVHGITDTSGLYRSGGTDVSLADGGTGASLADPGADRVLFWDDSAGVMTWLTMGTNLAITDTTLNASGSGMEGYPLFISDTSPVTSAERYLWIELAGADWTFWFEDGEP